MLVPEIRIMFRLLDFCKRSYRHSKSLRACNSHMPSASDGEFKQTSLLLFKTKGFTINNVEAPLSCTPTYYGELTSDLASCDYWLFQELKLCS